MAPGSQGRERRACGLRPQHRGARALRRLHVPLCKGAHTSRRLSSCAPLRVPRVTVPSGTPETRRSSHVLPTHRCRLRASCRPPCPLWVTCWRERPQARSAPGTARWVARAELQWALPRCRHQEAKESAGAEAQLRRLSCPTARAGRDGSWASSWSHCLQGWTLPLSPHLSS